MRLRIPFLFSLLLLSSLAVAQTNFKEGFVVTTKGDTLRGFIDYKEWDISPREISFRTSANSGTVQELTPADASYVEVTGMEAYRSYNGPITMDRVDKDNLAYAKADTSVRTDKVFLKKLTVGENAALYSYKDNIKRRFFIAEQGEGKPQELILRRYLMAANDSKVVDQRFYVGQLIIAANNQGKLTDQLKREIETAAYKEQDLLRVVSKINGRSDEEINQDKQRKAGARFFVGLALSRSTMETYGDDSFANAEDNPVSYMPRLTFGVDGFLNRHVQKLILRLEGGLTSASYHMQNTEQVGVHGYNELSYEVTQQTASLLPQLIYNLYNKEDLKVYVGGGFVLNYSNYPKNTYRRQYINPNTNTNRTAYENDNHKELLNLWSTYMLRTGVVVNRRYDISAMYIAPGIITNYALYYIQTGSINIGVNYMFRD